VRIPDRLVEGGYETVPVIDFRGASVEERVLSKLQYGFEEDLATQVYSYTHVRVGLKEIIIEELQKDDRKLLRKFAKFCERSGGFYQY
jgi:hypothetical protein